MDTIGNLASDFERKINNFLGYPNLTAEEFETAVDMLPATEADADTFTLEGASASVRGGVKRFLTPMTNRGVSKSNYLTHRSQNIAYYGGYDGGLSLGLDGTWQNLGWLIKILSEEKECAKTTTKVDRLHLITLGGAQFQILPHSAGKGVSYEFVLKGHGLTIMIHGNPKKNIQPVRVEYGFHALDGRNLREVHQEVLDWLWSIGFICEKETVSRVDMQVTLAMKPSMILDLIQKGHHVCRARSEHYHNHRGRGLETFTVGKDTQICIYNKALELLKTSLTDMEKCERVYSHFEGEPDDLVRVEFRLRRNALKIWGLNTVEQIIEGNPALVEYLTEKWFRILSRRKTAGNTSKMKVAPVWKLVQEAFKASFSGGQFDMVKKENEKVNDNNQLDKMLLGMATSWAAVHRIPADKALGQIIGFFRANEKEIVKKTELKQQERRLKIAPLQPSVKPKYALKQPDNITIDNYPFPDYGQQGEDREDTRCKITEYYKNRSDSPPQIERES